MSDLRAMLKTKYVALPEDVTVEEALRRSGDDVAYIVAVRGNRPTGVVSRQELKERASLGRTAMRVRGQSLGEQVHTPTLVMTVPADRQDVEAVFRVAANELWRRRDLPGVIVQGPDGEIYGVLPREVAASVAEREAEFEELSKDLVAELVDASRGDAGLEGPIRVPYEVWVCPKGDYQEVVFSYVGPILCPNHHIPLERRSKE